MTPGGIWIERPFDDPSNSRRQVRSQIAQGRRLAPGMCRFEIAHRVTFHRVTLREEVIQENPDAVDVARDGCRLTAEHFRREVQRCACKPPSRSRSLRLSRACAEIHQHDPAAGLTHDVLALDVAMEESCLVHRGHGAAHVDADERRFVRAERPAFLKQLLERDAVDELHPQTERAIELVHAVHRHDVRMANARKQPPLLHDCVRAGQRLQDFERHLAFEIRIPREVHRPEGASPDSSTQLQRTPRVGHRYGLSGLVLGAGVAARPVNRREARDDLQLLDHLPQLGIRRRLERSGPVDRSSVCDGGGKTHQPRIVTSHASSRLPAVRARVAPPSWPHRPSACRAWLQLRRSSARTRRGR